MDEIILLTDMSKKSTESPGSQDCECKEIVESVTMPLSQHYLALGDYGRAFYYLLESASAYVNLSHNYMAFTYLNTAESLLRSSEYKHKLINQFEVSVLYSLKGEVCYNMGQITSAKKLIKKALNLLKKSFPITVVGAFCMFMVESSKHLSHQKKQALWQISSGREKRLAVLFQQGHCLSLLWQLFNLDVARTRRTFTRLAALMQVNCAEESQDESQEMEKKRVAIIGAGSSGLCNIKCCLEEGLEPVCFESSDDIGGLWRFKENPEEDRASIYKSVIINTSKEMMCFSDFPIPDYFPNYMQNSKIMDYFRMYAKHFDLLKYIHLKTKVCSVTKCSDFSTSGQWDVTIESDGKQESSVFDAVLVCTGHHTNAHLPLDSFPGITTFKGQYLHSRDYKSPDAFTGKRVIVVGIGNSGVDLAVEISHTAQQVFLSTRHGAWILGRIGDKGYPLDTVLTTRAHSFLEQCLPVSMIDQLLQSKLNSRFDHSHYGLKPKHRFRSQHPTMNDDLPNCIISGKVIIKSNITEFTDTAAIFEDGSKEEDIDCVIFATGYTFSFPFLGNFMRVVENQISLYKFVFPPHLEKPTLAIIGLVQPLGAIMPISELQARWATRVFKGLAELPVTSEMISDIIVKKFSMAKRYVKSQRHTIQVNYIDYMDELASLIGVKPNLWSRFITDPKLAKELLFGPCTPYQYRLQGPGKWEGARKAILTQYERILKPLRTRPVTQSDSNASVLLWFKLVGLLVLFAAIWACF